MSSGPGLDVWVKEGSPTPGLSMGSPPRALAAGLRCVTRNVTGKGRPRSGAVLEVPVGCSDDAAVLEARQRYQPHHPVRLWQFAARLEVHHVSAK